MQGVATAEEPYPEPEQETFADAVDLVRRERSRKRKLLLSAGGAIVTTIAWVWWLESARSDARQWGALADAYTWGRGVGVFLVALVAASVASVFPRRTWFRFFTVYALGMTAGLVSLAQRSRLEQKYEALKSPSRSPNASTGDLQSRQLWLKQDFKQYSDALAKRPPFTEPALESSEAIDVSIRHFDNLINIIDLIKKLNLEIESSAPTGASPQTQELRQLLDAQKHDFELSRGMLELLRNNFGRWSYTKQGVKFEDPALQRKLEASAAEAAETLQEIRKLGARIEAGASPLKKQ